MKKNKLIIALLIVALFIPTYIAIGNYIYMSDTPVALGDADKIEIKDSVSGMVYSEDANSDIMELFKQMDKTATPINSLPSGLAGQSNFSVTAFDGTRETSSQYYIIKDNALGYRVDSKGAAYELDETMVAAFLDTKYAQGLYDEASVPTLLNGNNTILPTDYTWEYTPASGNGTVKASLTKTAAETATYTSKSGLSLKFSREPDTFNVIVKAADGTELYNGDYASMNGIDTKANPTVTVQATTKWSASEALPFGTASYIFVLDVEAQPEFSITYSGKSDDAFVLGDVAMITAESIKDPENLSATVSPALTHDGKEIKPVFYTDGTNSYAFLPTSYDSKAGEYTITLSYAGINETLVMNVGDKAFKNAGTHPASSERISTSYTDATLAAYDKVVEQVLSENDHSTKYFTDAIFLSANTGYTGVGGLFGYGRTKTLKDGSGVYRNEGLDYTMSTGHKVQSIMDGKVVYVGYTEFSGDTIAVDHGYGLISWYHNLDKNSIKVSVGDVVKQGDILCDKVATSGFTNGSTLHQRLTVNGVPICEYDLWEVGIKF